MTVSEHSGECRPLRRDKVFVSHSSGDDLYVQDVLRAVVTALEGVGYDVFADNRSLERGEAWESRIRAELADCDEAVVLIGRKAFDSKWVHREVEILVQEHVMRELPVLPVLLDGVKASDVLESRLDALAPMHLPPFSEGRQPASEVAEHLVSKHLPGPPVPEEGEPMVDWIQRVSDVLYRAPDRNALIRAARKLGFDHGELHQVKRPRRGPELLAYRLLTAELSDEVPATVRSLRRALGSGDSAVELVDELYPTWVDREAARVLLPSGSTSGSTSGSASGGRVALLNAYASKTAVHYIDRATCRGTRYPMLVNCLNGDEGEAPLSVFWEELRDAAEQLAAVNIEEPHAPPPSGDLYYLVLPVGGRACVGVLADAVRMVREQVPWLHVLVLVDVEAPDRELLDTWRLEDVAILPALGTERERRAHLQVRRLYMAVGNDTYQLPQRVTG